MIYVFVPVYLSTTIFEPHRTQFYLTTVSAYYYRFAYLYSYINIYLSKSIDFRTVKSRQYTDS